MEFGKQIFGDMPQVERESSLEANCLRSEEMPVKKYYDEQELLDMRREYTQNSIKIKQEVEKFKKIKEDTDKVIKPLNDHNTYLLNNIRTGHVEVKQQVYLLDDQENQLMHYYDAKGELINSRRLAPEERQTRII